MPSNDLLARYLQAVGFWLPRATKKDILAEISEDLHSQFEDRAASLNRPLDDAEIAEIVKQRGRPVVVAGTFLPQRQLIGTVLFPIYVFVLKIVALFYLLPWILVWIGFRIFDRLWLVRHGGGEFLGLPTFLWTLTWTLFGAITLIFAILDRTSTRSKFVNDWDPRKLPRINTAQSHRKLAGIGGIVFGALGLGWILAVPSFPFLALGPGAFFLEFAPVWHSVYPWIVVLAVAGIAGNVISLLRSLPAWALPVFKLATICLNAWVVATLLRTRTYFVAPSQPGAQWVSVTNLVVYLCLAGAAVGLLIAFIVQIWTTIQALEHPSEPAVTGMA
ncbi:MAG: hypothetical protein WA419_16940 [Silvibacterium sp.]